VRVLSVGNMGRTACPENVLAALDAGQKNSLAAGVKRPALLACMSACQAVVADNTQGGFVVNAGQFGLDTGGELSGCCHASNMRNGV
jgi:hypothetical protein